MERDRKIREMGERQRGKETEEDGEWRKRDGEVQKEME